MQDQQNILGEILKNNEKNINDLISQEMTVMLFACMFNEYDGINQSQHLIWNQIYLNTSKSLQNMFDYLLDNQIIELSFSEKEKIKQEIQLFVQELIQQKRIEVADKMRWLEKLR